MRAAIIAQCVRDQPSDGSAQSSIAKSIVLGDRQNPAMLVKTSSAVYKISICAIGNRRQRVGTAEKFHMSTASLSRVSSTGVLRTLRMLGL